MTRSRKPAVVTAVRPAGPGHQVVTVEGGRSGYRRKPCSGCPWRVDAVGAFPPEAFIHSARTANDMSEVTFACHNSLTRCKSGEVVSATCAGFLLRGADHNLSVRMARMTGTIRDDVRDGGFELHQNYRAMAVANGVAPDDPSLAKCRD
jgi:hypothetical protein